MSVIKRNVSIKDYQETWLKAHPEINFSGLVQKTMDEMIEKEKAAEAQKEGQEGV